ncbi:hypothetical protein J4E80_008069 [Alternaria sp. BMP 0032]|nr:hypothetical protein J4E80_008069 [Alternaria sp. BMP 0032]
MPQPHQARFAYPMVRPYPYRWYTPVVVVGGLCLTTLFTYINVAISGFDLVFETTFDPNATIAQRSQNGWPSWNILTNKIQPKCMPAELSRHDSFFTNQTALSYTLTAVWTEQDTQVTELPSLTYQNNILENCSIVSIGIQFQALDEATNQIRYAGWNTAVRTYATCQISNPLGTVFFNLTQTYNHVPSPTTLSRMKGRSSGREFLTHNKQTRASLWWGESLMSNYWGYTTWFMQQYRKKKLNADQQPIEKGLVYLMPTESVDDITDIDFFTPNYRFIVARDNGMGFKNIWPGSGNENSTTLGDLNGRSVYPNIWVPVDMLAKAAYSTVLADLGQVETPNILANETALEYFTANFTTIHEYLSTDRFGPERVPFDAQRSTSGPLGVVPSVIRQQYYCQVPQLKSTGDLVLSILIADLVLFQAAWQLFKVFTEWLVTRNGGDGPPDPDGAVEQGRTSPNSSSGTSTPSTGDSGIGASMVTRDPQHPSDGASSSASSDTAPQPSDNSPLTTLSVHEHGAHVPRHAAESATSLDHGP